MLVKRPRQPGLCGQVRVFPSVARTPRIRISGGQTMTQSSTLTPAKALAERNHAHFPNEDAAYRKARNALLAEEIELRRHIERVAGMRRQLPRAAKCSKPITSPARTARSRWPTCSATRTR
jgi:hypothetical protein